VKREVLVYPMILTGLDSQYSRSQTDMCMYASY
jgi:hypothetical protein